MELKPLPVLCCPVFSCSPLFISVSSKGSVLAGGGMNRFQQLLTNNLCTRFVYGTAQYSLCPNSSRLRQMTLV